MSEFNSVKTMKKIRELISIYQSNKNDIIYYTNTHANVYNVFIYILKQENRDIHKKINALLGIY
jgi:hypothetical protein